MKKASDSDGADQSCSKIDVDTSLADWTCPKQGKFETSAAESHHVILAALISNEL